MYRVLVIVNAVCGALLASSGALTAYLGTLGNSARWVSVILGVLGVAQLLTAAIIHATTIPVPEPETKPQASPQYVPPAP